MKKELSFEEALKELEEIVVNLEKGDISLVKANSKTGQAPPPISMVSKKHIKEEGPSQLIKSELQNKVEMAKKGITETTTKEPTSAKVEIQAKPIAEIKEKVVVDSKMN